MARAMKDSGVTWIGEIPEGWKTIRFKYLHNGMNTGEGIDKEYWSKDEHDHIFYTAGLEPIRTNYSEFPQWKLTNAGDLLLARNGTPYVYLPTEGACYTDHIIRALMKKNTIREFIRYGLQQSIATVVVDSVSLATWSASLWNEQVIAWPPLLEQSRIAAFLDHRSAEIDHIMEQTRVTIEEYKQLKQSIITEAVTHGVRGPRKMKRSDIPWSQEIPIEWNSVHPKALFSQRKEKALPGEKQLTASQQLGVVYQDEYMERTGSKIVTVEKDFDILKHVEAGDFVISMRSFQGGLEYSTKTGSISSAYVMLVPHLDKVFPRFFRWLLKSPVYINALQSTSNMVRDGQAMRFSNFAQVRLYTVPLEEQKEIADYLDHRCAEIDRLIDSKQQLLTELEAYKKSVIYEYVTGKREVPQ